MNQFDWMTHRLKSIVLLWVFFCYNLHPIFLFFKVNPIHWIEELQATITKKPGFCLLACLGGYLFLWAVHSGMVLCALLVSPLSSVAARQLFPTRLILWSKSPAVKEIRTKSSWGWDIQCSFVWLVVCLKKMPLNSDRPMCLVGTWRQGAAAIDFLNSKCEWQTQSNTNESQNVICNLSTPSFACGDR